MKFNNGVIAPAGEWPLLEIVNHDEESRENEPQIESTLKRLSPLEGQS